MPKIKILYTSPDYNDAWGRSILQDQTDWEEVTEEELKLLKKYDHLIPHFEGFSPHIVMCPTSVIPTIASIRKYVAEEAKKKETTRIAAEAKRKAREEKAKLTERKRKLKQLMELKKELGDGD